MPIHAALGVLWSSANAEEQMKTADICNAEVVTVGTHDSLRDAAALMRQHHVGDVVVVDRSGGYLAPLGILTDRDIVVEVVAEGVELDDVTVGDAMTGELITAGEDDELLSTLERMREHAVRRLPVINDKGVLVGIVTLDDIIGLLAKQLTEVWALIVRERRHEVELRG
jgi:CBS domain-containing protein